MKLDPRKHHQAFIVYAQASSPPSSSSPFWHYNGKEGVKKFSPSCKIKGGEYASSRRPEGSGKGKLIRAGICGAHILYIIETAAATVATIAATAT